MEITGKDFRLVQVQAGSTAFDVYVLVKSINQKTKEEYDRWSNVGYAVNLERAVELIGISRLGDSYDDLLKAISKLTNEVTKVAGEIKSLVREYNKKIK